MFILPTTGLIYIYINDFQGLKQMEVFLLLLEIGLCFPGRLPFTSPVGFKRVYYCCFCSRGPK